MSGTSRGLVPEVPVVIVGGGPVVLSTSIFLSRQGIRSLLVERHAGTALHPKARGVSIRTMEIFRQHGLGQAVRDTGSKECSLLDVRRLIPRRFAGTGRFRAAVGSGLGPAVIYLKRSFL